MLSFCSFFSRQRYVLGDKAMLRVATSNVLLIGLGGLGIEIGKFRINLLLTNKDNPIFPEINGIPLNDIEFSKKVGLFVPAFSMVTRIPISF